MPYGPKSSADWRCRFYDEAGREVALRTEDGWRAKWPRGQAVALVAPAGEGAAMPPLPCRRQAGEAETLEILFTCKGRNAKVRAAWGLPVGVGGGAVLRRPRPRPPGSAS